MANGLKECGEVGLSQLRSCEKWELIVVGLFSNHNFFKLLQILLKRIPVLKRNIHNPSVGEQNWGHWCHSHGCTIWVWSIEFTIQLSVSLYTEIYWYQMEMEQKQGSEEESS